MYTKEFTIIGLVISFIVLVLNLFSTNEDEMYCDYLKKIKSSKIKGIIINKRVEKNDHNSNVVYFFNNGQKRRLPGFYEDFYEYISEGDTILKKINSDTILVKKRDEEKLFILDLSCK